MKVAHSHVNQHTADNELPTLSNPAFAQLPAASNTSGYKPSYSTDDAANQILRGGYRHYDRDGDGTIELSFTLDNAFSPQQKTAIRKALQAWQDVTTLVFKERAGGADGSITIKADPTTSGGISQLPEATHGHVTTTIGTDDAADAPQNGDYFLLTAVHELGHALGLGHPGNYGKGVHSYADTPYQQDTRAHSVMSYWRETNQPGHDFKRRNPAVPLKDDIAAVQKLYGPNYNARNTDTTYGFNSNTGNEYFSLQSSSDQPIFSIWDGGGHDTLDFSGFSQDQNINLQAQSYSDVGGLKGNVSIAKNVVVEDARGGSGDDRIKGNQVGNRITGGAGADTLTGGGGANVFAYDWSSDSTPDRYDQILDFTSGTDKIDLSGLLENAGIKHFKVVEQFTGRAGECVLAYDPDSGYASLSLDLSGRGKADFFIGSVGGIQVDDIVTSEQPGPGLNAGDTVYGFNANAADRAMRLHAGSGAPDFVVQDAGGNDTLDFSGFRQNQIIDLRERAASSVGGQRNNVSIGEGVTVENAIGGAGRDRILGNLESNGITGGAGGDELWGVGGRNTFKYNQFSDSRAYDPDQLMDFASGEDTIDLTALATKLRTPLRLVSAYTGRVGDTVVRHDPQTGRSHVGIDLLGKRQSDFLIRSARLIRPEDVLGLR
ncbi:M10 family metallopeptidase C-terminal domain-containing protein [Pseudomonas graminis]